MLWGCIEKWSSVEHPEIVWEHAPPFLAWHAGFHGVGKDFIVS